MSHGCSITGLAKKRESGREGEREGGKEKEKEGRREGQSAASQLSGGLESFHYTRDNSNKAFGT